MTIFIVRKGYLPGKQRLKNLEIEKIRKTDLKFLTKGVIKMLFYKTQAEYRRDKYKHESPHSRMMELAERMRRLNNRNVIRSQNFSGIDKTFDTIKFLDRD